MLWFQKTSSATAYQTSIQNEKHLVAGMAMQSITSSDEDERNCFARKRLHRKLLRKDEDTGPDESRRSQLEFDAASMLLRIAGIDQEESCIRCMW